MSALAMILAKSGYSISGSDSKKLSILKELESNAINIFESQEPINIDKIIKVNNENFCLSFFFKKADLKAITKSSLPEAIFLNIQIT